MFSSLFGRQGDKGDKGDQGDQGIQGVKGDKGDKGDAGDAGGFNWIDRGDIGAYDFVKAGLTIDGNWHDMDLASIIGAARGLVCIRLELINATPQSSLEFRTKGYTGTYNQRITYVHVANITNEQDVWVYTDASGVIQYKATNNVWVATNVLVRGYSLL